MLRDLLHARAALAISALVLAVSTASTACGNGDPAAPATNVGDGDSGTGDPAPQAPSIASPKSNVRFLDAPRMSKSFAKALALPEDELCKELGQYQCVGFIHKISLLGTDPYLFGVNDPLPTTTTSTPLVAERVATAGCVSRVRTDRATHATKTKFKDGALFHRLVIDANGKLDSTSKEVSETIDQLYVRVLQRHASAAELEQFRQLYRDVESLPSPKPAEDWAVASCVAVLTSMESLFY